jgi:hypothetical protein
VSDAELARSMTSANSPGLEERKAIVRQAIAKAVQDNQRDVHEVIALGLAGSDKVLDAARAGIRNTGFLGEYYEGWRRFRSEARAINDAGIKSAELKDKLRDQENALALDPVDIEIAGNLAYYHARAGNVDLAFQHAIYALSVPRPPTSEGRTADWQLLGSMSALRGRLQDSEGAYAMALAMATNPLSKSQYPPNERLSRFCYSLLINQRDFGSALDKPVEAIIRRAGARLPPGADQGNCRLPPGWLPGR